MGPAVFRLAVVLSFSAALLPGLAWGQLDAVDPDAKPKSKSEPAGGEVDPWGDPIGEGEEAPPPKKTNLNTLDPDARPRPKPAVKPAPDSEAGAEEQPAPAAPAPAAAKKKGAKPAEPAPEPARPRAPQLIITRAGDAELEAAWDNWRRADASKDTRAEASARAALKALMAEVGATALEPYAMGFIRASRAHDKAGDATGSIELAQAAIELAPELPSAHFGLALAYASADPSEVGRWLSAFQVAAGKALADPRFLRPFVADLGSGLLYALVATAIAVTAVLFIRRARYFFYDVHWFFPRVVARWQSVAVGVLIVLSPFVFGLGLVPTLLVLFAASTLYMTLPERAVTAVAIGLVGLVPLLAAVLVEATAFAGTPAERVWELDQGGPGAEVRAQELTRKAAEGQAAFAELAALGSFELRRGKLDLAMGHLRSALDRSNDEPSATNNLAVAMMLSGDLENPRTLLPNAAKADADFAAPLYNSWRLAQRRHAVLGDLAAAEVDEGNAALSEAKLRDPALGSRYDPPAEKLLANQVMLLAPTPRDRILELARLPDADTRVQSQLTLTLLGDVPEVIAPFYPLVAALLLLGLGFLSMAVEAARACNKCGRPVSRREDKDLSPASQMCTQCINVFARKGVVPPSLKVRKQVEVARYQQTMGRASFVFGLLCSGMGHVFAGWPVRGAIYAFAFLFTVVMFVQREGVLRVIYEGPPAWMRLFPLGALFALVYLLSLRGLFRRQS